MGFNYEQYETVLSKDTNDFSNCDGWLNASGDAVDLQAKLDVLYSKRDALQGVKNTSQERYDFYNSIKKKNKSEESMKKMYYGMLMKAVDNINANNGIIASTEKALRERKQYDIDEAKRVYDAAQKVIDDARIEKIRLDKIDQKRLDDAERERIRLAGIEQTRLEDAAKKVINDAKIAQDKIISDAAIELAKTTAKNLADAKSKEQDIKKEIDLKLVEKGVVPEAVLKQAELAGQAVVEAAKINATAQAKVTELTGVSTISNKKYFIIGGVLLAIFGAYFFFGKKSNN
jgi:hypothetical protein